MKTNIFTSQRPGGTPLYLVVALGLLFFATTLAASSLTRSEVTQSSDVSRSDRAYLAAEAGVEEAIRRLNRYPQESVGDLFSEQFVGTSQLGDKAVITNENGDFVDLTINTEDGLPPGANVGLMWRNRIISDQDFQPEGTLQKDESVQIDTSELRRETPGGVIQCTVPGAECDTVGGAPQNTFDAIEFCYTSSIGNPELEMTVISWQKDNAQDVTATKFIANQIGNSTFSGIHLTRQSEFVVDIPTNERCFRIVKSNASADDHRYIFRLRPLYRGVGNIANQGAFSIDYTLEFISSDAGRYYIPNDAVLIDVTGQSGDIRRRIVVKKQRVGGIINVFDFGLYSGDPASPLCKAGVLQGDVTAYDDCINP